MIRGLFLALLLTACAPAVDYSEIIDAQNEQIALLSDGNKSLQDAYLSLEAQYNELAAQPEPTALPTAIPPTEEANIEEASCPNPDYFKALTVGYLPGTGIGHKSHAVSVSVGCVAASISFANGEYVTGQMAEDGKSLVTCVLVKGDLRYDCDQFNIRTTGEYKVQARAHKKGGGLHTLICLAEHVKAYTDNCD